MARPRPNVDPNAPSCPECGKPMRKRTAKSSGKPFWGCSGFPSCRGYRPYTGDVTAKRGKTIPNPSPFQQDVFEWIQYGKGNAVVEAVAGSGKTSTMVHASTLFSKKDDSLFLAFNKHIADELQTKLPHHVTAGTMHSICLRAIRAVWKVDIEDGKTRGIIGTAVLRRMGEGSSPAARASVAKPLERIVSLLKSTLTDPRNTEAAQTLLRTFQITFQEMEHEELALSMLPEIMDACAADRATVDFDDMIWFIHVHNMQVKQYDWVVVDEAQDLNNLQMEVLKKLVKPTGRCICVGDRAQSIYGFRGANCQAIPLLIEKLNAKVLPLSICYRCPSKHIELAKDLVPQIESAETAIPGMVGRYTYSEALRQLDNGDLILCRNNAPLVSLCFSLIEDGRKATIKGRDIGTSLVNLIKSLKAKDLEDLDQKARAYCVREVTKLKNKGQDAAAQMMEDRFAVINVISSRPSVHCVQDIINFIEELFSDTAHVGVTCSSVHKAKGLEADSVYILFPALMPAKYAKTEEDMQQERNIEYVALTRSKKFLGFIEDTQCRDE